MVSDFGPKARRAVPALRLLLNDPDEIVQMNARDALKAILEP